MPIADAVTHALEHREEIIFGALTGLLTAPLSPLPVELPRLHNATDSTPQRATHLGQTLPQDTPALLWLVRTITEGVDERAEYDAHTGQLLLQLGRSFRRHGLTTDHYACLAEAITQSIDRHLGANRPGVGKLNSAVELACSVLAHGAALATEEDTQRSETGTPPNPVTTRATVLEVERRNASTVVVRLQAAPPVKFAIAEPLLVRTPYTPNVWRPLFSSIPADPHGLLEFHVDSGSETQVPDAISGQFAKGITAHVHPGDEWVLSPQPTDYHGKPLGLRLSNAHLLNHRAQDVLIVAEGTALAPARAAILQQVFGGVLGASPEATPEEIHPGGVAPLPRRVHLFWGAHNPGKLYELLGLKGLHSSFDWFRLTTVVSQRSIPDGVNPSHVAVGLTSEDLRNPTRLSNWSQQFEVGDVLDVALAHARNLDSKNVIVAGSPELVQHARREFIERRDVPPEQFFAVCPRCVVLG